MPVKGLVRTLRWQTDSPNSYEAFAKSSKPVNAGTYPWESPFLDAEKPLSRVVILACSSGISSILHGF